MLPENSRHKSELILHMREEPFYDSQSKNKGFVAQTTWSAKRVSCSRASQGITMCRSVAHRPAAWII
jgi:hypothetical protein